MTNSNATSIGVTIPSSPRAVWHNNTNTVSPGANGNFTFDRSQRSSAIMSHNYLPGFSPRTGHSRTRSTITIPRSSWFNDSNGFSPTTQSRVFPISACPNDLTTGHSYCLDRGNGEFTRLIPADLLPALNEVPAREIRPHGMVILPSLGKQVSGSFSTARDKHVTFRTTQKQMDNIASSGPSNKKNKIYCDKWVHEGVCAFTQQGCKFKHEMPFDEATQRSLGLFQGFPAWWKKRSEDTIIDKSIPAPTPSACEVEFSSANEGPAQTVMEVVGHTEQRVISHSGLHGGYRTGPRSQWMKNGIVPFFNGPIRDLQQSRETSSSVSQRGSMNDEFIEASIGRSQCGSRR